MIAQNTTPTPGEDPSTNPTNSTNAAATVATSPTATSETERIQGPTGSQGNATSQDRTINFGRIWNVTLRLSIVLIVLAIASLIIRPLNLGIEFQGGVSWEIRSETLNAPTLRTALEPYGLEDARIQQVANDLWRIRGPLGSSEDLEIVKSALAQSANVDIGQVSANSVGASWGSEVTAKARTALIVFFVVLFVYMTLRLEWKAAAAALIAVAHDIFLTLGVYAVAGFEVTSATVIAFLTILGYSLYDTLVVFDKIQENERRARGLDTRYSDVVSYSAGQVLTRSINTTITSLIPVLSVLGVGRFLLGALTLQEFALALLIGLIVGTYSSLFIATPLLVIFKERESRQLDDRLTKALARSPGYIGAENLREALADADSQRLARKRADLLAQRQLPKGRVVIGDIPRDTPEESGPLPNTDSTTQDIDALDQIAQMAQMAQDMWQPTEIADDLVGDIEVKDQDPKRRKPVVRKSVGEIKPRPKKRR